MRLTADHVAMAIVTASRELGANPIRVLDGQKDVLRTQMVYETTRARAYAALALHGVFPTLPHAKLGRMVGAPSPDAYLSVLKNRHRAGDLRWMVPEALERVIAAVCAVPSAPAAESPASEAPDAETRQRPSEKVLARVEMEPEGEDEAEPVADAAPAPARAPAPRAAPPHRNIRPGNFTADVRAPLQARRPAATPGKRNLLDDLRRAVENTAAMTPPPEE